MIKTLLIGTLLLFAAFLLMGIRIFFTKGGKFPNTHIGGNKTLTDRGIHCANTQDAEMRAESSPIEKMLKSEKVSSY
ncbi:MAG: hypothetical protein LBS52_08660 [Dysgonamonadaceae bacterium]|jgi:hypothetical protein|nr:hypothetical protein [Dysgonamonadaceae bacterium]